MARGVLGTMAATTEAVLQTGRFNLVSNCERTEIIRSHGYPKMLSEGGIWTSCTSGKDTEEECRIANGVPDEPCRECGKIFETTYLEPIKQEMLADNICFSCHHWRGLFRSKGNSKCLVIDGKHYMIGPRAEDSQYNGFGGAKFVILFDDGRQVETNNLWHQGVVPAVWRERLPDNAKFVRKATKAIANPA